MTMKSSILALGVALALAPALPAQAALITYNSRAAFNGAAGVLPTETFEEGNVGPGNAVPCPGTLDSSSSNACFLPGDILAGLQLVNVPVVRPGDGLALTGTGFSGITSKAIFANFFVDTLRMNLAPGVTALGFDLYSLNTSTVDVALLGPGGPLGAFAVLAAASGGGTFFGVISDQPITAVTFASRTGEAEGVDNVSFGTVPEPTSLALLGTAMLGVGMRRLRLRRG